MDFFPTTVSFPHRFFVIGRGFLNEVGCLYALLIGAGVLLARGFSKK
jgi:hypothetical protein